MTGENEKSEEESENKGTVVMTIISFDWTLEKYFLSCRDALWYLAFCGFAVNAMLENNVSLTIIAMVVPRPPGAIVAQCKPHLGNNTSTNHSNLMVNGSSATNLEEQNLMRISVPSAALAMTHENTSPVILVHYPDRFTWNEYEQGLVLGGAFWLHWATQLPGGFLARCYGTKIVFGFSILITALLGLLTPFCVRHHLYAIVALRVLQGFCSGFAWPSMHDMTAKWIPITERSKFISSYLGSSVGTAMTYPLSALLINWFGWESVFYVTSALGVIWYTAWYYMAYDTPQAHPRISEAERMYLYRNLGDSVNHFSSRLVPWKAILTSRPLWITAIAFCGGNWGLYTIGSEAPSYYNYIQGWDISTTCVLSAAPQVIRMLFSYIFSSFTDWLLRTNRMSTTNLRKLAMFVCNGVQSFMFLGLALSGCHPTLAIVFMIVGTATSGSLTAGSLASCIDLSPNYASIILGICNIASAFAGFLAPLIVGILTNNNQTTEQWQLAFLITAAIIFATGIPYILVGTSDLQPWNGVENEDKFEELQKLRFKKSAMKHGKGCSTGLKVRYSINMTKYVGPPSQSYPMHINLMSQKLPVQIVVELGNCDCADRGMGT